MPRQKLLFRSKPISLSQDEAKSIMEKYDFFDKYFNYTGKGSYNLYKLQTINDDKVVIDKVSGLTWQQGGSSEKMNYDKAKKWIEDLNNNGYAGRQDWRLPTLEEAMSLMAPKENDDGLYTNPVFSKRQKWIWTADKVKGTLWARMVFFNSGYCLSNGFYDLNYVRAVCSEQSSAM